jgi:cell fate regulator YaaT (PSP1 superfamily)
MRDGDSNVAGVRFRNAGKIFYFHTAGMRLEPGEYVVVETTHGPEIAKVVIAPDQVVVNELGREELKPILRLATEDDIRRADELQQKATELLPEARRLAEEAGFPARIDAAEYTLDGRRLTFSFTSERLDCRDFLSALATASAPASTCAARRAGPGEARRRLRHLRPRTLLRQLARHLPLHLHPNGQGTGTPPQPPEDQRPLRAPPLLPLL